ncbi:MAG: 16S rRNA (cytidine(1402)-2'-O)-methyltransferase [Nitrospirae bacterium]|nr:16S rRNA (cytidine(1402)-2'-O)-methyltransferase [Nitrospirota bacterium]
MSGILYIVSTPIGNLEDITLRALRILKEVDLIAAEDTRHTRKLLSHFEISKPLISYWGAKEKTKAEEVLRHLRAGKSVALVTDAGTPGISDPGEVVIKRAIEEGISIVPVPGPSALVTALSVSGISTREFLFIGFLSANPNARKKKLKSLEYETRTIVFYESPHRILDTLDDILEILGDRQIALCHELTKLNEEVLRGRVSEVLEALQERVIAGEYVVVVSGAEDRRLTPEEAVSEVLMLMKKGLRRKEAVKKVSSQYKISQKELYDLSLKKEG